MIIELSTDSEAWMKVKHALRAAGLKYHFQDQLFSTNKSLFVESRTLEPEGGELRHGFLIYDGGSPVASQVYEVDEQEVQK